MLVPMEVTVASVLLQAASLTLALALALPAALARPATSRARFEEANASINNGDGYKSSDNLNATLAWGESYIMMGYMAMYRATGDRMYLDRLCNHADAVLASRDDIAGVTEFDGKSSACWANTKYQPGKEPYCYVVHSGMITYPMADFAATVLADPELWNLPAYDGFSYKKKADLYLLRVAETVAFHDPDWKSGPGVGEGHYVFDPQATFLDAAGQEMPLNQQNAMGRTLVALHSATGKPEYLQKASALANRFAGQLLVQSGAYVWNYSGGAYDAPGEDISHAAINVDFARLCAQSGIVFSDLDMDRFATTFYSNVYIDSKTIADHVGGSGSVNGDGYKPQIGRWLNLTPWNPSIYTVVRDVYDGKSTQTGSGSEVLGFANLALWEPKTLPHFFYYVDWTDGPDLMTASANSSNVLTAPPDPAVRYMVRLTVASGSDVSVEQWDGSKYHSVARWAGDAGWTQHLVPYHPDWWHAYWNQGALFQFVESPFAGIKVKKPESPVLPAITTTELPVAIIGTSWSAGLTGTGDGPLAWALGSGPAGMTIQWDTGVLSWPAVPAPPAALSVEIFLDNDFGTASVVLPLSVTYGEGDPCDDGDACTMNETWVGGQCVGEPMKCLPNHVCDNGLCILTEVEMPVPEPVEPSPDVVSGETFGDGGPDAGLDAKSDANGAGDGRPDAGLDAKSDANGAGDDADGAGDGGPDAGGSRASDAASEAGAGPFLLPDGGTDGSGSGGSGDSGGGGGCSASRPGGLSAALCVLLALALALLTGVRSSVWQEPAWRGAGETGVQPQLPRLPRKQSGSCQSATAAIAPCSPGRSCAKPRLRSLGPLTGPVFRRVSWRGV
jgi:hypothetical protein